MTTNTEPPADVMEALAKLTDAFLSRHGCFPTDIATPEQREWHEAMQLAYSIVGQPNTPERVAALSTQPAPTEPPADVVERDDPRVTVAAQAYRQSVRDNPAGTIYDHLAAALSAQPAPERKTNDRPTNHTG